MSIQTDHEQSVPQVSKGSYEPREVTRGAKTPPHQYALGASKLLKPLLRRVTRSSEKLPSRISQSST